MSSGLWYFSRTLGCVWVKRIVQSWLNACPLNMSTWNIPFVLPQDFSTGWIELIEDQSCSIDFIETNKFVYPLLVVQGRRKIFGSKTKSILPTQLRKLVTHKIQAKHCPNFIKYSLLCLNWFFLLVCGSHVRRNGNWMLGFGGESSSSTKKTQ